MPRKKTQWLTESGRHWIDVEDLPTWDEIDGGPPGETPLEAARRVREKAQSSPQRCFEFSEALINQKRD